MCVEDRLVFVRDISGGLADIHAFGLSGSHSVDGLVFGPVGVEPDFHPAAGSPFQLPAFFVPLRKQQFLIPCHKADGAACLICLHKQLVGHQVNGGGGFFVHPGALCPADGDGGMEAVFDLSALCKSDPHDGAAHGT